MTLDAVIVRQGRVETTPVLPVYDRPEYLGVRALNSPSTLYLPLADLEYAIDEARRSQSIPKGTE